MPQRIQELVAVPPGVQELVAVAAGVQESAPASPTHQLPAGSTTGRETGTGTGGPALADRRDSSGDTDSSRCANYYLKQRDTRNSNR